MATTFVDYTGDGNATKQFSFPSYKVEDIKVEVDNVVKTVSTHYNITSYTTTGGGNVVFTSGNIPASPAAIRIFRDTDVDTAKATYTAGSSVKAGDLNNNQTQLLYAAQEEQNQTVITSHIKDAAVTTAKIKADNITGALIADDQINSEHYVADSIDTEHYAPGSVDSAAIGASQVTTNELANDAVTTIKITDLNVTTAKIANDAINGTKIADDSINSEHYVDGSVDHVHLANDIIDGDNIQDDVVNSEHIAAGALDNEHYAAGSITSDKLNGATVITASEQGSATTNDTSFLTSAAADARFFNISSGDTIKDGQTFPDNDTTIATTAAINDRIIDIVNDVGGFDIIASEQHFPNTNPQGAAGSAAVLSVKAASTTLTPSGTTVTITNGNLADNADITITGVTAAIPSGFGFLVESTGTLHTYTFHRLVPNATEVTTVAGVASNITTVAGVASNVTTVAGISSNITTVAGNTSNINAVAGNASNINAVAADASDIGVVAADGTDIGLVAGSITNVNTAATNIASVNNASANISSIANFGDQYQVASSNPSTDGGGNALAEGDLYFNTTANELKVYNGGAWQGGVTASGNFASTTGNTFTGDNLYSDNAKLKLGTGSDLELFHNANNSIINDAGTGTLQMQTGGSTKLEIQSGGVGVTGNITVSGNVDGRDVAADGSSLDNFEAGNVTTDVTNGNIKLTPNGTGVAEVRGVGGADGTLQLNCSQNSHGIKLKSPAHSAGASYTLTFPNSIVNNGALKTDSSGNLSFGLVESANITDGTIVNADINASAAIAGTKIAPDFGSQNVATTGTITGGTITSNAGTNNQVVIGHDGSIEISRNSGGAFIDFKSTTSEDHDARIQENSGGFDISGNVNIASGCDVTGTITASAGLDIAGNIIVDRGAKIGTVATGQSSINIGTSGGSQIGFNQEGTNDDSIRFYTHKSGVAHVERLRITEDGHLLPGSDNGYDLGGSSNRFAQAYAHTVNASNNLYSGSRIGRDSNDYLTFADNDRMDIFINGNNEFRFEADGDFHADGDITAFSTTTASDARLKSDIHTINDALGIVGKLRGVSYKWLRDGKSDIGVIAQEVEQVIPEVVKTKKTLGLDGEEEIKTVDYGKMVGVLINAINELKAEIEELKNAKTTG